MRYFFWNVGTGKWTEVSKGEYRLSLDLCMEGDKFARIEPYFKNPQENLVKSNLG